MNNKVWKENNFLLREMSCSLSELKNRLQDRSFPLIVHLLKIFYYRNHTETVNHWKTEVCGFVEKVPKVKQKNDYPSFGLIRLCLFNCDDEEFTDIQRVKIEEFNETYTSFEKITSINPTAKDFCSAYVDWLSEKLHENGVINRQEASAKIDCLLQQYPL